jgi:diguanylate cyclase (GGDEF)-like protein/putative nucleotidyltransferase with HDIG domain
MTHQGTPPSDSTARPAHLRLVGGGAHRSVDALIEQGQAAEREGRREQAREFFERALYLLGDRARAPLASALLRWIGRTHQVDANLDAALDCLDAALAVARACGDEAAIGHAINLQAIVHWQQGRLDDAERLYLEARESALKAGDANLAAMTSQNLGVIASIRGELLEALRHYENSLADYRALGLARDVSVALNNLGKLYTEMKRWGAAERAYEEAISITTVLGDLSTRIVIEVNLAELWVAQRVFDRARQACDRAMATSRQIQDRRAHGEVCKVSGIIARETGDHALAEAHFASAERIADERQDLLLAAETARELAELHRVRGRNRDMLLCLNRAHRLFTQLRARRAVADIDLRTSRLESEFLDVVRRWGESIESKDRYTQGHCVRVADLSCALAARVGMDEKSLFWFRIGALLHDIGKLVIPAEVLNKPGKLTAAEWAMIERHPMAGVALLSDIDFPWDVLPIVRSHHERWDGKGYPDGLAGEAIPSTARILCIADAYDALTSIRSYKDPVRHEKAMEILRRDVGTQFDAELFLHFEDVVRDGPLPSTYAAPSVAMLPERTPPGARPAARAGVVAAAKVAVQQMDDLTGLLLRRPFLDAASTLLATHLASGAPVSLLVVDVDHFKLVNDTHGHLQGDDVLRAVADALRRQLRATDILGRYAGDEFVVVLSQTALPDAQEVAERIRAAVQLHQCPLRGADGIFISATLSIGAATAPQHGSSVEELFAAADRALYEAKRQGRNAVASAAGGDTPSPAPQLKIERFVGREEELRRLERLLDATVHGEPSVAAIVGEAGVGKSTLLRQLAPEVRERAGWLVSGGCLEADVRPPYGPWAEVIKQIHLLDVVPVRRWRELPRLVPALGSPSVPMGGPPAGSKYVLLDEIAEYLRLATTSRPLVVVLDDMQWADVASWDTLEHVLNGLSREHLLVCLTIRAEDTFGQALERQRRLAHDERFHEVTLSRLTRDELKQWIDTVFHGQESGRELLAFLYRQTEGNPLFIVQALRALVEEGAVWYTGERWEWRRDMELRLPVAVNDLLTRRLDRLSPKARAILTTAAVVGRSFDIDLVIAAGAGTNNELLEAIDQGIASAVIDRVGEDDGDQFAFTHVLLVEAMLRSANGRRVKRIHERVAQAFEKQRPSAVAEIAAHYDQAGGSEKAHHYALLAGARATSVYAHGEATAFYAMAERHATAEQLPEVRLRLAHVAEAAGRYADAEGLCDLVLAALDRGGDAQLTLSVARMRERLRALQGQPPRRTLEECQALLGEARSLGVAREQVALLTMISEAHSRLGDWPAAEKLAQECVAMAEEMGDSDLLADALKRLGTTMLESRPSEAIACFARALDLFTKAGDRYGQVRCHINAGIAHSRAGNGVAAAESYALALELGRSAHAPDLAGLASLNLGVLHLQAGRYDQARERFDEALRLFTTVKNEPNRLTTLYNLAHLARERGDAASALALYTETAALARSIGQHDVEIGAVAGAGLSGLALGRRDVSDSGVRDATALIDGRAEWWFQGRELAEALSVRAALTAGDEHLAERRFGEALALAERHDPYGAAWLVADCATPLAASGLSSVRKTVARYVPLVEALGYAQLSARYAAFGGRTDDGDMSTRAAGKRG